MIEKNSEHIVEIIDLTHEGLGFARLDGKAVFIENALVGELVRIKIIKVTSNYFVAKVLEHIKPSKDRVKVIDSKGTWTGTTPLQHLCYDKQLVFKTKIVQDLVDKVLKNDIKVLNTLASPLIQSYRNKAQIPVRNKNGHLITGFFRKNTHELVEIEDYIIQDKDIDHLIIKVRDKLDYLAITAYDENRHCGLLRHIIVRKATETKQMQVVLVMLEKPNKELCKQIQNTFQDLDLTSLVININPLKTNVIMGKEKIVLIGQDYITDYLLGKEFRISSNSFYQINHQQTERLYQTVIDFCDFKGDEVVLDAYCGIGTIALSLSQYVKKVYGIEIVQDAIDMAKDNARLNSVKNCEFEAAAVEDVIEEYKRLHLDVVVVDPPRKGLDEKSIQQLIEINPKKIVYVSCNPNTLVRDLKMLSFNYQLVKIQPVDMFPMTVHVETVALLSKLNSSKHIDLELTMDELDLTASEKKATYQEIKDYILEKYGFKVSTLYIAQIKRKCGLELREQYNISKKENKKVPICPKEKEDAIMDALKYFKMI